VLKNSTSDFFKVCCHIPCGEIVEYGAIVDVGFLYRTNFFDGNEFFNNIGRELPDARRLLHRMKELDSKWTVESRRNALGIVQSSKNQDFHSLADSLESFAKSARKEAPPGSLEDAKPHFTYTK
jgi:hypothetical protein